MVLATSSNILLCTDLNLEDCLSFSCTNKTTNEYKPESGEKKFINVYPSAFYHKEGRDSEVSSSLRDSWHLMIACWGGEITFFSVVDSGKLFLLSK